MNHLPRSRHAVFLAIAIATASLSAHATAASTTSGTPSATANEKLPAWTPQRGHDRPIVAIVGDNAGTEVTDFVIPYGVLKRAGIDTVALATHEGTFRFRPALVARLDATTAQFDVTHPEGADYVVVPAVANPSDPTLLAWITEQSRKGATVVSICDGALVVGNTGLLDGKWATAHWGSESHRRQHFPSTHWVGNARYVVDGNVVSSSGISAAMPTSIALVEAIAGTARASALATELGVSDWGPRHDSEAFRPHYGNLGAFAVKLAINPLFRRTQKVGVPLADGIDEIALAVTADAYSRTGRSQAFSFSPTADAVTSRNGLVFVPDAVGAPENLDVLLPPLAAGAPAKVFDTALAGLESRYGRRTAYAVALDFEYPGYVP